jgi:hypothetical protein
LQYIQGIRGVVRRLRNQDYRSVCCSLQIPDDICIGLFEVNVIFGRRVFRADNVRAIDIRHVFSVKDLFLHVPKPMTLKIRGNGTLLSTLRAVYPGDVVEIFVGIERKIWSRNSPVDFDWMWRIRCRRHNSDLANPGCPVTYEEEVFPRGAASWGSPMGHSSEVPRATSHSPLVGTIELWGLWGLWGFKRALREIAFLTRSLNSLACLFYFVLVPLLELPVFVKSDAIGYLIIAQNLWRSSRCHARLEILQCLTNAL